MILLCSGCKKKCLRHSRYLTCFICDRAYYIRCLANVTQDDKIYIDRLNRTWICLNCSHSLFPFNHIQDDNEFNKTISESWLKPIDIRLDDLEKLVFNPFSISGCDVNFPLCHSDPDMQFYNNSETNNILKSCSYLVEDSFNKRCLELRNESDLFSVIHSNARRIPKNFDNFLENVEIQFTAIGVSETWLNETNQNLYGIKGYSQVNNYRPEKRGGGVSLFFNESLEYCRRNDLSFMNNSVESIFVDISPHY